MGGIESGGEEVFLRVHTLDGSVDVNTVTDIEVPNGSLTDLGGGHISLTFGASIGGTITGGNASDILFINPANTLAQDDNFQYLGSNGALYLRSVSNQNLFRGVVPDSQNQNIIDIKQENNNPLFTLGPDSLGIGAVGATGNYIDANQNGLSVGFLNGSHFFFINNGNFNGTDENYARTYFHADSSGFYSEDASTGFITIQASNNGSIFTYDSTLGGANVLGLNGSGIQISDPSNSGNQYLSITNSGSIVTSNTSSGNNLLNVSNARIQVDESVAGNTMLDFNASNAGSSYLRLIDSTFSNTFFEVNQDRIQFSNQPNGDQIFTVIRSNPELILTDVSSGNNVVDLSSDQCHFYNGTTGNEYLMANGFNGQFQLLHNGSGYAYIYDSGFYMNDNNNSGNQLLNFTSANFNFYDTSNGDAVFGIFNNHITAEDSTTGNQYAYITSGNLVLNNSTTNNVYLYADETRITLQNASTNSVFNAYDGGIASYQNGQNLFQATTNALDLWNPGNSNNNYLHASEGSFFGKDSGSALSFDFSSTGYCKFYQGGSLFFQVDNTSVGLGAYNNSGGSYLTASDGAFASLNNGTAELVATNGLITTYHSINTVGNGVPSEFATVDLTAQTAAITATTLYSATGSGLYRISFCAKVTTPGTTSVLGGAGGFQVKYTDADDSVTVTSSAIVNTNTLALNTNTTQTVYNGTYVFNAKGGTAIQYLMGYTSVGTAMQYNLHIILEKL